MLDVANPLHVTTQELSTAVDRLNCGVLARDASGHILYANERLGQWLGVLPHRLVGRSVLELVPEDLREAVEAELIAVEGGDERARLNALRRADGSTFPVLVLPHPEFDEERNYLGSITLFLDMGTVQTAKPVGYLPQADVRTTLGRIALELQAITMTAELPTTAGVPLHHPELEELSPREREVLGQLMTGYRVPAIAEQLHISQHTVRNHLKSIYRKAGVQGQDELVRWVHSLSAD